MIHETIATKSNVTQVDLDYPAQSSSGSVMWGGGVVVRKSSLSCGVSSVAPVCACVLCYSSYIVLVYCSSRESLFFPHSYSFHSAPSVHLKICTVACRC